MFLHDEGGMHQVRSWTQHVLKNHNIDCLRTRKINRICVWGERQKQILGARLTELSDSIRVTGTPKFDLCLPQFSWVTSEKSKEKLTRYGPHILVCTRFALAAHSQGQGDPFRREMNNPTLWPKTLDRGSIADLWFSTWQRDVHDFADFVCLVKEIASHYPQYTIILRPHPSENAIFYEQAFASFANVVVTKEDSVLVWIRSAELVIHSNCTTGIEAVLAGRPVLNLIPACEARSELDVEVAREAGCVARSIDEALSVTGRLLEGSESMPVWTPHAQSILYNLTNEAIPQLAIETNRVIQEAQITASDIEVPISLRGIMARLINHAGPDYAASKRPPLEPEHVGRLLNGCRENGIGNARLQNIAKTYVVVDPA
jgi:surface carbohydrate biosynthesis protein